MRILIAFNNYADIPTGGERNVVTAEAKLLKDHGHEVFIWERSNAEIQKNLTTKLRAFRDISWSEKMMQDAGLVIDTFKPDIFHLHNYWLLLTPSVFAAAKKRGIPTVHTLHNFRMICPGCQLMYKGNICEKCLQDKHFIRSLFRKCFLDGSFLKTFLSWKLYHATRKRNFLSEYVSRFISLTEFSRNKFIQGGLQPDKIVVKPNFLEDPLTSENNFSIATPSKGAIFIGRISQEKGILQLLTAWKQINYPLTIIGEGPLDEQARNLARENPNPHNILFTGRLPHTEALQYLAKSAFLIFPSVWYETFGLTMIEAMALKKPVIASDLGGRDEIVQHEISGLLYDTENPQDLVDKVNRMIQMPDSEKAKMGEAGRTHYLKNYTPETNYEQLLAIYQNLLE